MKRLLSILAIAAITVLAVPRLSQAQSLGHDYRTGLGVKLGWWGGGAISLKHFVKPDAAVEGLLSFWPDGFVVGGLYEFHGDITGAPGLKWYVGPGAHLGFWNDNYRNDHPNVSGGAYFGLDGVLGLDYKFYRAPIDLSVDVQPGFNIPSGDFYTWGGLGIRYTF